MAEEFRTWRERHFHEDIAPVMEALNEPMSDDPEALWTQLKNIEPFHARLGYILALADGYLDRATEIRLPKAERYTEQERRIQVEANVSEERSFRDMVKYLMRSVEQRIGLGQSRLAYCRDVHHGPTTRG